MKDHPQIHLEFQPWQNIFFQYSRSYGKLLILIEFPNIFHSKLAKKETKREGFKGQIFSQIWSDIKKNTAYH